MYLLDTDHIAILQWQTQPEFARLRQRINQQQPGNLYWSVVSFQEQTLGANLYVNRARTTQGVIDGYRMYRKILVDYCAAQVLPFDQAAATEFDGLRTQRVRIGTMDLRIAAIALSRNLTVLTRNLRDFSQVPGLRSEDWTV